ncbi:hypothetical protein LIER_27080 [Lithospermum erythrorhizon]|uniref:Uncharacterized protein n=1 Tax=Lithospermum erythrorhizon TaxID=34254 RepID=A0AAV3RE03_LITER
MLDRWLPDLPSRQMKRLLRNSKLTVLCLILTIIVIRGNLGAATSGPPRKTSITSVTHFPIFENGPNLVGFLNKFNH